MKMSNMQWSDYFVKLDKASKERYLSKLTVLQDLDPYVLKGGDCIKDFAVLLPLR